MREKKRKENLTNLPKDIQTYTLNGTNIVTHKSQHYRHSLCMLIHHKNGKAVCCCYCATKIGNALSHIFTDHSSGPGMEHSVHGM